MPSYFQEDRFRSVREQVAVSAQSAYVGTEASVRSIPYRFNDETRAVEPVNPSRGQRLAGSAGDIIGLINDAARGYSDYRKNESSNQIMGEVAKQLPAGQQFDVATHYPDAYAGNGDAETVDIYPKGEFPGAVHTPGSEVRVRTVMGKNSDIQQPGQVTFTNKSGEQQQARVNLPPPPAPKTSPPKQSVVDKEPGGFRLGRPERVPADARFDRSYPGFRDVRNIA